MSNAPERFAALVNKMRSGDLIFLLCDQTPFSRAIVAASAPEEQLDHVGIIDCTSSGIMVIEANSNAGVTTTPLNDFLHRAPLLNEDLGWRLNRLPAEADVDIAESVLHARAHIGKVYNNRFIPTEDALYCSELVQVSFLTSEGKPYFKSSPMDFNTSDSAVNEFWRNHFKSLSMPIPQHCPGTSPCSIFRQTIPIIY